MKAHALVLAVVTSAALADGMALFKPGAPLQPAEAASVARLAPTIKRVEPVIIDPRALEIRVIHAPLGGKTYRFVGAKRELPLQRVVGPFDPTDPEKPPPITYESAGFVWEGSTPQGDRAYITQGEYGIGGHFLAGGTRYQIVYSGWAIRRGGGRSQARATHAEL